MTVNFIIVAFCFMLKMSNLLAKRGKLCYNKCVNILYEDMFDAG